VTPKPGEGGVKVILKSENGPVRVARNRAAAWTSREVQNIRSRIITKKGCLASQLERGLDRGGR